MLRITICCTFTIWMGEIDIENMASHECSNGNHENCTRTTFIWTASDGFIFFHHQHHGAPNHWGKQKGSCGQILANLQGTSFTRTFSKVTNKLTCLHLPHFFIVDWCVLLDGSTNTELFSNSRKKSSAHCELIWIAVDYISSFHETKANPTWKLFAIPWTWST